MSRGSQLAPLTRTVPTLASAFTCVGSPGAAGAHHTRLADGLHNLISHDTLSFIEPFSYGGGAALWPGGVYQARSSSSARSSSEGMRGLLWVQMSSRALAAMEGR